MTSNPADVQDIVEAQIVSDEVADCISRGEALIALERVAHETADDLPESCTVQYALLAVMNRAYQAINLLNFKDTRQSTQAVEVERLRAALQQSRSAVIEECVAAIEEQKARGQPLSSFQERFACNQCIAAIRALSQVKT